MIYNCYLWSHIFSSCAPCSTSSNLVTALENSDAHQFSLTGEKYINYTSAINVAGRMKREKLFYTTTSVDSLVSLHCSIQHRLPPCLVDYICFCLLSEHGYIYLVMYSSLLSCTYKKPHDHCKQKQKGSYQYSGVGWWSSIQHGAGISWASICTRKWNSHPKCI